MSNIDTHDVLGQDNLTDCAQNIAYYLGLAPNAGSLASGRQDGIIAATAGINSTETLLNSIPLYLPNSVTGTPGTLNAASFIRITLLGTCTASAANVPTFTIRAGTLGTVADASVAAIALAASATSGTAIPFRAVIEMNVRTLGATGTAAGSLTLTNQGTTGLSTTATQVVPFTSATLATTTATFLDITFVAAAATTTCTFQNATIEIES